MITKGFSAISEFHTGKTAKTTVQTPNEIKNIKYFEGMPAIKHITIKIGK